MSLGCYYYPAAFGRLGAIKARGLQISIIHDLLQKDNVNECISVLRQNPIPMWDRIKGENLEEDEYYLRRGIVLEADKIFKFMNGKGKNIFRLIVCKIDLYNLKLIARNILSQRIDKKELVKRIYSFGSSFINKDKILEIEGIEQIASCLGGGVFKEIFDEALKEYNNKKDIFYFELNLEYNYYNRLWEYLSNLGFVEYQAIKNSFFDLQQGIREFLWMVRLRHLSGLENNEIFHYLNLNSSYFNKDDFWSLSEIDNFEDLKSQLNHYKIGEIIKDKLNNIREIAQLEINLNRYLWKRLNTTSISTYPFQLIIFLLFIYKQSYLIQDIIRILQGKKNNFPKEGILEYLVTIK